MILQIIKINKKNILFTPLFLIKLIYYLIRVLIPRTTKDLIFQCNEDLTIFFLFIKYTVKNNVKYIHK